MINSHTIDATQHFCDNWKVVKRIFFTIIVLALFLTSFTSYALAQNGQGSAPNAGTSAQTEPAAGISLEEDKMIAPDFPIGRGGVMPFAGQNHYYSVVFRGNGESITTLRVALTNTNEDSELSEVTLRLPKIDPKDLSVYQIIAQGQCVRYDDRPAIQVYPYTPKCLEYGEPYYTYLYGNIKYQKAEAEIAGDTLKVTLPTPIASLKTGSFFVYFRGFGYAAKNLFGAYKYDFETLKVEDAINQLTVGISTDADQFLKGAKGEVDYRLSEASIAMKAAPSADMGAVENTAIDQFVSQIGQGHIIKTASNLAASESYKVQGVYADSRAKLYGRELATVLIVIIFFILLVALVLYAIQKRTFKKDKVHPDANKVTSDEGMKRLALTGGVSFVSSLTAAGYSIAVYAIGNAIGNLVDYQYQAVIMILLIVISFAIYVLLLIGPSFFVGMKKGLGWGVGTFVMSIVWLILFAVVTVVILFVFRNEPNYPPVPLVRGGLETINSAE